MFLENGMHVQQKCPCGISCIDVHFSWSTLKTILNTLKFQFHMNNNNCFKLPHMQLNLINGNDETICDGHGMFVSICTWRQSHPSDTSDIVKQSTILKLTNWYSQQVCERFSALFINNVFRSTVVKRQHRSRWLPTFSSSPNSGKRL